MKAMEPNKQAKKAINHTFAKLIFDMGQLISHQ